VAEGSRCRESMRVRTPNAPVLLRAIYSTWAMKFADRKIPTGNQPNDYQALVCSNYR
jgi:hypothetical protein